MIEITRYTRDDGVVMNKLPSGNWVIKLSEVGDYYDKNRPINDCWALNSAYNYDLEKLSMTFDDAYAKLIIVPAP